MVITKDEGGIDIRHFIRYLWISIMVTLLLVACNENGATFNENDVKTLLRNYKEQQYNIQDHTNPPNPSAIEEQVKPYLSKELLQKHNANRVFTIAPQLAMKISKNIKLTKVSLKKDQTNKDGSITYNYTLSITFYDNQSSKTVTKEGNITISNKDGYKIVNEKESRDTQIDDTLF